MAKVTITIEDTDKGLEVNGKFDPPADGPDTDTEAQSVARALMITLSEVIDWDVRSINESAD